MTHLSERAQALTLAVPGNDLDAYMRAVNAVPVLSADEEQRLGERLYYDQDLHAPRILVLSLLPFLAHIPPTHTRFGLPLGHPLQEGHSALFISPQPFYPTTRARLFRFAVHRLHSDIPQSLFPH